MHRFAYSYQRATGIVANFCRVGSSTVPSTTVWRCRYPSYFEDDLQHTFRIFRYTQSRNRHSSAIRTAPLDIVAENELPKYTEQRKPISVNADHLISTPKNVLSNVTDISKKHAVSMDFRYVTRQHAATKRWETTLKMTMASSAMNTDGKRGTGSGRIFTGIHARKQNAEMNAALAAVAFLIENGVLDANGRVLIGGVSVEQKSIIKQRRTKPVPLSPLSLRQLDAVRKFLTSYAEFCSDAPSEAAVVVADPGSLLESELGNVHVLTSNTYTPPSPEQLAALNARLATHYAQRANEPSMRSRSQQRSHLPIHAHRDKLLDMIEQHQVIIVAGETGSGKSTQLPQYILDRYIERNRGAECGIVITQPRRISTLSLSERVAYERCEQLGDSVGYQVRLDACLPRLHGFIFYCTTATMVNALRGVATASKRLSGLTHLIIDEVHVRDAYIDTLLAAVKQMMPSHPNLRVILMSASMNHALLSRHFDDCPVIDMPGRTFPVTERFLPDVMRQIGSYSPTDINAMCTRLRTDPEHLLAGTDLILQTIELIDKRRPPGALMCFLPGWQEIQHIDKAIRTSKFYNSARHVIHRLHSRIPLAEQHRVFRSVGPQQRKIILATNVAESSITVDDVRYVIDTGLHRENFFDPERNSTCLKLSRTARANTTQRKGRAGRVAPGECFLLFTEETYQQSREFPLPEIKRMPLESVCLESKMLAPDATMPVAQFLRYMPEPPAAGDVDDAVQRLIDLGVFMRPSVTTSDENVRNTASDGEELTPLGRRIAHFTSHPRMSIALLYSRMLRCIGPIVTAAAMYTSSREPFLNTLETRSEIQRRKRQLAENCDWQAIAHLMRRYREECRNDDAEQFCRQWQLDAETMKFIEGSRGIFIKHLFDAYLLNDMSEAGNNDGNVNDEDDDDRRSSLSPGSALRSPAASENDMLDVFLRAAICAGYGDQLARAVPPDDDRRPKSSEKRKVFMLDVGHSGEIASNSAIDVSTLPEHALIAYGSKRVYQRDTNYHAVSMSDATLVHPLHVLLFTRRLTPRITTTKAGDVFIEFAELPHLKMQCDTVQEAETLIKLRAAVHGTVEHAIASIQVDARVVELLTQLRAVVAECVPEQR